MSIVVVGSLALDTVKTPKGEVTEALGGSAAYFALAARFFVPVELVAVVGRDFPAEHLERLRRHDVGLEHVEVASGDTFRWGGEYGDDPNVRETLFTHLNVFQTWRPSLPAVLGASPYLFLANLDPALQARMLEQAAGGGLVAADTMNFWIEGYRQALVDTLRSVDICFMNDSEAKLLAGCANLYAAGRAIMAMGPATVVIKKGEHGVVVMTQDSIFQLPAFPVTEVVDPTGAGDSFAGGMLGYVAEQGRHDAATLRRAAAVATALASFTVERFSVDGLCALQRPALDRRVAELHQMCRFDMDPQPAVSRGAST